MLVLVCRYIVVLTAVFRLWPIAFSTHRAEEEVAVHVVFCGGGVPTKKYFAKSAVNVVLCAYAYICILATFLKHRWAHEKRLIRTAIDRLFFCPVLLYIYIHGRA